MKIYPDPELPDIEATWFAEDCRVGTGDVALTLTGVDTPTFRAELTVACAATKATFVDIPRERYKLDATLRTTAGDEFASYEQDFDLRNGLDKRADMYFGGFANVRVAWAFEAGSSCESLGAELVTVEFSNPDLGEPFGLSAPCQESVLFATLPDGLFTALARAESQQATVAVSPVSDEFELTVDGLTDVGTLVLAPCGADCP